MESNGKQYPRIHSLSTIGLRHHYNCDYIFHPLRTDFTGDSGIGKSMIADMLQLILIGTSAKDVFQMATDSHGQSRTTAKMIYKNEDMQGLGYIWLNVILDENRYVAIGHYIAAYSSKTKPFIIQQGYDWVNPLTPFHQPVYYKSFLRSGQILPFEDLQKELLAKGLNCEDFINTKYLKILAFNEILPVDLSINRKDLRDYAQIIYSFSRGKGFSKKSKDLKDFIFGIEEEKRALESFKVDVSHLQDSLIQHYQNNEEIESINEKGKILEELLKLKKKLDISWEEYLTAKLIYWSRKHEDFLKDKLRCQRDLLKLTNKRKITQIIINKIKLGNIQKRLSSWKKEKELIEGYLQQYDTLSVQRDQLKSGDVQNIFFSYKEKSDSINSVNSWIKIHGGTINKLIEFYNYQTDNLINRSLLQEFLDYLNNHKVTSFFLDSKYISNPAQARGLHQAEISHLADQIQYKSALHSFFGLDEEYSLSRWALNRITRSGKAFSKEEECVIIYFQQYYVPKPDASKGSRFLPDPEILMNDFTIAEKSDKGFWLNLGGLWEFIEYQSNYLLNTNDEETIKKYFKEANNTLEAEIEQLNNRKESIEKLDKVLSDFMPANKAISLYKQKEYIDSFPIDSNLPSNYQIFQEYIALYNDSETLLADYATTKQQYQLYNQIENRLEVLAGDINRLTTSLEELSNEKLQEELFRLQEQVKNDAVEFLEIENSTILETEINNAIEGKDDFFLSLHTLLGTFESQVISTLRKEKELILIIDSSEESKLKASKDYYSAFKKVVDYREHINKYTIDPDTPDKEKDYYYQALTNYLQEFNSIFKSTFGRAFQYKYPDENSKRYGFATIARDLLPKIFNNKDPETIEFDLSNAILIRLEEIQNKNKDISESKLRIFVKHFENVLKKYGEHTRHIKQLQAFFQREDAVITGGHRVKISFSLSREYPVKWLEIFVRELKEKINYQSGLFAELANKISILDTLTAAYRNAGGILETPSEENLLNPKSYFELDFDIVDESGNSNDGSTGQTYTATALLCLARMALLTKVPRGDRKPGLRIMPIDEAEGLGSNYDSLYKLAKAEDYQIITLSIGLVGRFQEGMQYVYMLNPNSQKGLKINDAPFAIFNKLTPGKLLEEDVEAFIEENSINIDQHLSLKEIVGLNRIYIDGRTDLQIKEHPYIQKVLSQGIIHAKTSNDRILEKGEGFDEWYQQGYLEAYQDYHNFLTKTQIVGDEREWQYRYHFTEDDIRALMLIHSQKRELKRTNFLSKREISSKFFKNSKRLIQQDAIAKAVLKVLEVDLFIDDEHDKQYLFTLNCPSPKCIILCENLNFLKLPWKARKLGIELWYCGGSNTEKLDHLPERYKPTSLPIYYSCDWDLAGLRIFQKIKEDYLDKIKLLYPTAVPKKLKDSTKEEHKSEWDYTKPLSGLKAKSFLDKEQSLINALIIGKEWIEEESNDFDDFIAYNGCIL